MDYLKLLPTTIPWRRTRHEHNTPCQRWKGHPVDDTGQVYILAWKCPRVSVAARVPVYRARGYKACHVPAGVLPPGVRSSGPNQPASPNQLQRAASPTTIEITLSLAASLPRDSRFSFSLKCHALEMGPLDCRPLDLLILPDHRTIRETGRFDDYADCSWWWSIFYSLSYFLSFLLSLSLSLFFFSSFLGRKNWLLAAQSVNRTRCERSGIIGTIRIEHGNCFWKLCAWNRIYLYFFKKKLETFDDFVTSKILEMFRLHFLVIVSEKSWNCRDIILFH